MHPFDVWVISLYIYCIEGKLGRTVFGQVVGYCMGNRNDFRSMGLSHLQSEILDPFVLEHRFKPEFKSHSEKALFDTFFGMQHLCIPNELGFGFYAVLMPLLYVSKWHTTIWLLLMGHWRSVNLKICTFVQMAILKGKTPLFVICHLRQRNQFSGSYSRTHKDSYDLDA